MKEIEMDKLKKLAIFTQKIKTEYLKGVKPKQLIQRLIEKDVNVVIDIRWSSVYPIYFAPKNLKDTLKAHNIEYIRYHELGNPTKLRDEAGENFELAKKLYLEYIIDNFKARQSFKELFKQFRLRKNYCLICYCKTINPLLCHRFWFKEALVNAKRISLGFKGNYELDLEPMPIIQEAN